MIKCSRCQGENRDDAEFCGNCGNRLTAADWATGVAPRSEDARRVPGPASARQPEAVAAEDNNAAALRLVAEGRLSEALEALNEAIRLAPNHAASYLNRADVLGRLGMISQAEADRRTAARLAPASTPPTESAAAAVCPSCGQRAPAGAGFCSECGRVLSAVVYAGFWMRLLAAIIDGLILLIPNIVVTAAVTDPVARFLIQLIIGLAYTVGFWTAQGATPGKMAVGIEITTAAGEPIGFGTALLRYIGYLASTITLLIGYLMIAFTPQKRGLHDYIAGTVVIKTR